MTTTYVAAQKYLTNIIICQKIFDFFRSFISRLFIYFKFIYRKIYNDGYPLITGTFYNSKPGTFLLLKDLWILNPVIV